MTALASSRQLPGNLELQLFHDLASASAPWRGAGARLVGSAYQTESVCRAWFETEGSGTTPLVVVAGRPEWPTLVLPLALRRAGPVTIASLPCGSHANYGTALFDPLVWSRPNSPSIIALLQGASARAGIDAFAFERVPAWWGDAMNPLYALPGQAAVDPAWRTKLDPDRDATLARLRGGPALKKLRAKERKLAELGPVRHLVARDPVERARVFAAFREQKARWFARNGIPNGFEDPATAAFLKALTEGDTPVEWHALLAGERIVATDGLFVHGGRVSAALNSYDPEVHRQSPGEILLRDVVGQMAERGMTTFDLGAGDFAYKRHWCDTSDELRDVAIGFTPLGRLAAAAIRIERDMKRRIKADPRLRALADRLRGRGKSAPPEA